MSLSKMLWSMVVVVAGAYGLASAQYPNYPVYPPYGSAPGMWGPIYSGGSGLCGADAAGRARHAGCPLQPIHAHFAVYPEYAVHAEPSPDPIPTDAGAAAGMAAAGGGSTVGTGGGEGGSGSLTSGAPNMVGDLGVKGVYRDRKLFPPVIVRQAPSLPSGSGMLGGGGIGGGLGGGIPTTPQIQAPVQQPPTVSPLVAAGQFRIIENESPRPQDRLFFAVNYFDDVGNQPGINTYNLTRATLGFERTFFEGYASFGMRLPIFYRDGGVGQTVDGFGDITAIAKVAFLNDGCNAFGGGVALTFPVRQLEVLELDDNTSKNINSILIQPYVGVLCSDGPFYVQGFLSYVLPTNTTDTQFLSADIGVGMTLFQNPGCLLTAIIPTIEVHGIAPLNNRSVSNAINGLATVGFTDQLVLTGAVHLGLDDRAYLTLAYATPVTGPNLFNYEVAVQLNWGF